MTPRADPVLCAVQPTVTLFMENLLSVGQVRDAADREDMRQEVEEECAATGSPAVVVVPEPPLWVPNEEPAPVFARFESEAACEAAKAAMNGRTFEANTVTAKFISDELWNKMRAGEWVDHKYVIDNPNAGAASMGQVRLVMCMLWSQYSARWSAPVSLLATTAECPMHVGHACDATSISMRACSPLT